ncbi:hypothetical protein [Thauera sinica]|uniref:Uncharacterized protein n=1 Tax=Thauera sinica TaxID=2665146 RepID=A0ABW1AP04_9RHOO
MPAERTIRRLRVRAPDEALARRARLLVEDALRTASLPGQGGAVVLVRRLRLPPFSGTATPQSVALALEARCRALAVLPVTAATSEDDVAAAAAVRFRDPLHARLELGARVLGGAAPHAWCWPLAVPGYHAGLGAGEALRAIAMSIAGLPEAAAALPLWLDGIAARGAVPRLFAALSEGDAVCLLAVLPPAALSRTQRRAAALPGAARPAADVPAGVPAAPAPEAAPRWREPLRWAGRHFGPSDARRQLLQACALWIPGTVAGGMPEAIPQAMRNGADARHAAEPAEVRRKRDPAAEASATRQDAEPRPPGVPLSRAADRPRRGVAGARPGETAGGAADGAAGSQRGVPEPDAMRRMTVTQEGTAAARPTSAAGLLFLLRVMESLCLPEWLAADAAWASVQLPARIFGRVLRRLRVDDGDPAWLLAAFDPAVALPAVPFRISGEGQWAMLAAAGMRAAQARTVEDAWLNACRRRLRMGARIGLADLVRRPGLLAITATHADVWMAIGQTDLRIRRAGLDLDPGWVPWLGRVVHFHYGDAAP